MIPGLLQRKKTWLESNDLGHCLNVFVEILKGVGSEIQHNL